MRISTSSKAQESVSGIKGGLNLSSLTTDGNDDKNLKAGFHLGVYNKIPLGASVAIQPELLYSVKGMKLDYNESAILPSPSEYFLLPLRFYEAYPCTI